MKQIHNEEGAENLTTLAMEQLLGLSMTVSEISVRGMNELGLSRARAHLLWELERRGAVTQRELAQALKVTPRNVTGLLDAMQESELVIREPHPTDRRATLVRLSPAGKRLAGNMHAGEREWGRNLFAELSESELRSFVSTLESLHAKLLPQLDQAAEEARKLA